MGSSTSSPLWTVPTLKSLLFFQQRGCTPGARPIFCLNHSLAMLAALLSWQLKGLHGTRNVPPKSLEFTPPRFNSSTLTNGGWKISFLLGWHIFRDYVNFREGILLTSSTDLKIPKHVLITEGETMCSKSPGGNVGMCVKRFLKTKNIHWWKLINSKTLHVDRY